MKTIIDNIAVEYEDEGEGPVLLLLHGWMNTLRSFDALVEKLRGKYRLVRIDLPGFGNTEPPPSPWCVEDYAKFVQHFLEKKELKPAAIAGHSFGGRVAIKGLGRSILKAEKLILIASAGNARRNTPKMAAYKAAAKVGKAIGVFLPASTREELRERLYTQAGSDYARAGALSATFVTTVAEDLTADAAKISAPALLLWGSVDTSTPLEDGRRLAKVIKNSELRVYEGAGHQLHRERPREVAEAIRHFV